MFTQLRCLIVSFESQTGDLLATGHLLAPRKLHAYHFAFDSRIHEVFIRRLVKPKQFFFFQKLYRIVIHTTGHYSVTCKSQVRELQGLCNSLQEMSPERLTVQWQRKSQNPAEALPAFQSHRADRFTSRAPKQLSPSGCVPGVSPYPHSRARTWNPPSF